jgi:hypothetical protein
MLVPPGVYTFKTQSISASPPLWTSTTGWIKNSQSSVAGVGLSLGENHSPINSLTRRELLTGLTTCLFYHGPKKPVLPPVPNSIPASSR